jgi:hypothetical protein
VKKSRSKMIRRVGGREEMMRGTGAGTKEIMRRRN